jgi:hypothetical protein
MKRSSPAFSRKKKKVAEKPLSFFFNLGIHFEQEGEHKGNAIVENGAAKPLAAASLMRSKSISNGLHAVQPDPVAADILRKEPQQESFIKMLTTPEGMALLIHNSSQC